MKAVPSNWLAHLLAYHRLLISGTFSKPVAVAVGLLLALGLSTVAGGIYRFKPGLAHAGSIVVLMAFSMMAVCVLSTAGRAASRSLQQMTPHVSAAAFAYLYGLWWLQVCLGIGLALVNGVPPVIGLMAGVLYAMLGNSIGGSGYLQTAVGLALWLALSLETDYHFVVGLPTAGQFVLLAVLLAAAAWHARAGVEGTLNPVRTPMDLGEMPAVSYSAGNFAAIVGAASKSRRVSLGLGPSFDSLHWTFVTAIAVVTAGVAWRASFNAQAYFAFMGAGCALMVSCYLLMLWRLYLAAGARKDVLIFAPALPDVAGWNGVLGKLVMQRAALVGMVCLFATAGLGYLRFGQAGGWQWWAVSGGASFLASLGAWANYHGTLRVRTGITIFLGIAAFIAQAILFNVVNPFSDS